MKRVWSGSTLPDTTHLKNLLEQAGIDCFLKNRDLSGGLGDLPIFECSPELWILEDHEAERAEALLRAAVQPTRHRAGAPWCCRQCGAESEAQFAACWRCGELDERGAA